MISELGTPQYYVQSVEIDVDPTIGEPVKGTVFSSFEVSEPELRADPSGLSCQATLELELFPADETPLNAIDEEEESDAQQFGNVEITCLVFVPGDQSELEIYHSTWRERGYRNLDPAFISHIESGLLPEILTPVGNLLSSSFAGIIPWMRFTPIDESTNDDRERST